MESHIGGSLYIPKIATALNGYNAYNKEIVTQYTKGVSDQLFAFVYLENSDQTKY